MCGSLFSFANACERTLRVGINELYWPPYIIHKNGVFSGMEVEAMSLLFEGSGMCSEFIVYPNSSRMLAEIKDGRVDMLFAATETEERKEYAHFSVPYRLEIMSLYMHGSMSYNEFDVKEFARKGMVFGINSGSYYGEFISDLKKRKLLKYVNLPNARKRFELLNMKRIDFVLEDRLAGNYMISDNQYNNVVNTGVVIQSIPVRYMLSKKTVDQHVLNTINYSIQKKRRDILKVFN
nr:transporter substrate-binding domain-containing protein [Bowmanella yangjiangensis]